MESVLRLRTSDKPHKSPVFAREISDNQKTGPVSVSGASQHTCPRDCPFLGSGCYAEQGMFGINVGRWNAHEETDPITIARLEARAIGRLSGKRDLRVHVVGDARTRRAARIIARAMRKHREKHGRRAWTYTHSWRKVSRDCWGEESVLASCETPADVLEARAAGYATALVVDAFASNRAYQIGNGVKVIPCPAMTRDDVTCASCGLCMDAQRLHAAGLTIAFEAHGSQHKRVAETVKGRVALTVL